MGQLAADVARPAYDRSAQHVGIVHIGLGAFARAHLAVYTDLAAAEGDRGWITGVSLRSPEVASQLNPQDGLYCVAEQSVQGTSYRLIGSIDRVLVAPEEPDAVIAALAAVTTRIVSFTVTEKGYCRTAGGSLDLAVTANGSFYPLLARALRKRCDLQLPGLTLLSCDNLAANGVVLLRLVGEYLAASDPELIEWFEEQCTCPSTMVDRIVPATREADRAAAAAAIGLRDEALVVTEQFSQWVIEDRFTNGRPAWNRAGAQFVASVNPYETAKLRMLNGAHSLLAYCGLEAGYERVDQAIADPRLRGLTLRLMLHEAAPTISPATGQDLEQYCASLIERFENSALDHRLAQIAMDGSQKIPQRWLSVLADRKSKGLDSPAIYEGLSAWMRHVGGTIRTVEDPLASALADAWSIGPVSGLIEAMFGPGGLIVSAWHPDQSETRKLLDALQR